ncbi:MAG TPA: LamG domain-containing protein [Pirellulales bacterium]|jgi:hypothetical protein|nr:LamG domain-containing protein [Pirellulales bacterium]
MLQLIDDYLDGTADNAAIAQLKAWLEADGENVEIFAREVFFHQQLRESLLAENSARFLKESSNPAAAEGIAEEQSKPARFPQGLGGSFFTWPRSPLGMLLLFVVAIAACCYAAFRIGAMGNFADPRATQRVAGDKGDAVPYVAKLVKVTNCLWDSTHSTAALKRDSELSPGQSLCLLEGVAEINSVLSDGKVGQFILEGPVSLMMTSQGVPSLQYGKVSVAISGESDFYALETGLGSVIASNDASFGIISYANKVELHVFSGGVIFDPSQLFSAGNLAGPLPVAAGSSLRVSVDAERSIAVQKGMAEEGAFITQASMNASHLNIPKNYVTAIKQAKPVAYWRFDNVQENLVPNEMGDRFACRIEGHVDWRTYPNGNQTAEFGMSSQSGLLLSNDDLADALKDAYSIEFWMKPGYCQFGSIFLLVKCNADSSKLPLHGAMVELIGPASDPSSSASQIDRIRFLHRNPPGMSPKTGTSCYSNVTYTPRIWQHVAAVKDGVQMKLFLDGKVAAEATDTTDTPAGLRILMGQLFTFTSGPNAATRPFVGELDEVALYDRPLTEAEINKHIRLVRTAAADGNTW